MGKKTIGVFVGSFRKGSFSQKVARFVASELEGRFALRFFALDTLPLFNQDYDDEGSTPPEWVIFREEVAALSGVLFVSPEYNRSYPAVLKNALDIASRPAGQSCWAGKPGAILTVSPGHMGGFGASRHLRQVLSFLDIRMMNQPEGYIADITAALDEQGVISDERMQAHLRKAATAISDWMEQQAPG